MNYLQIDTNNNIKGFIRCSEYDLINYKEAYPDSDFISTELDTFEFDSNFTYKIENNEITKNERTDSSYLSYKRKLSKQNIVENIEVTYNDVVYQGDEKSQDRMSRAIVGSDDDDTIEWTAKDNSKVVLLRSDLKQILRLAGIEQTKVW